MLKKIDLDLKSLLKNIFLKTILNATTHGTTEWLDMKKCPQNITAGKLL